MATRKHRIPSLCEEDELGEVLIEGKTKVVHQHGRMAGHVVMVSKDGLTAFNGKRANTMEGKGEFATR